MNIGGTAWRSMAMSPGHWLALSVLVGICLPPLAALARPLLFPSIFALMLCTLLLIDLPKVLSALREDLAAVLVVALWQLLALPVAVGILHLYTPLGGPATLIAFYTACAGSLFGSAAFARLMQLDEGMALRGTLASMLLMPLTLPLLAGWVRGEAAGFDLAGYLWRLLVFLVLPMAIALACQWRPAVRQAVQRQPLVRHGAVVFLCLFAIAVMEGIGPRILGAPVAMAMLLLLAFAIHLGQFAVTAVVFARHQRRFAWTAGLLCSYRNLGMLLAVAGALLPDDFITFVGLWQVPMYLMPLLLPGFTRLLGLRKRR